MEQLSQADESLQFSTLSSDDHQKISALFLGPKAENVVFLMSRLSDIVQQQVDARQKYFPNDKRFIPDGSQQSEAFKKQMKTIEVNQMKLLTALGKRSLPFFSPRYSAHMCVDQSMPAILGYFSTMFYNPNNVTFEAGPLTTLIELKVGRQLCAMVGYNLAKGKDPYHHGEVEPVAWGHIASGGSVANLESVWASRNLKFYALALREALEKELAFISDKFKIETCNGDVKFLTECTSWEMLNFKTRTILDIPRRLNTEYHISLDFLNNTLSKYIIQTVNKEKWMEKWDIKERPVVMASATKHYSWPKAAAITGIGSSNLIDLPLDKFARVDIAKLDIILQQYLDRKCAVYEIVAVIGTTEEGAVDPLDQIIDLRHKYEKLGMSFVVHADAAWGGYFATMLDKSRVTILPFVPPVGLREHTIQQLSSLRLADSITMDPHKTGYVPYAAGALCYRDGRMKDLLTWSAAVLGSSSLSVGIYGVEGSKPGAAPVAVWMAHESVGLNPKGHGSLLGQAMFTCRRYAAHWSAMSTNKTSFVVTPFNHLPSELESGSTPETIEEEREYIRSGILNRSNLEIYKDEKAMALLNQLGSDLNINAFACNFRYRNEELNTDVEEANWLNRRIFERLSATSVEDDPLTIPFYLTSTTFTQREYGAAVVEMKRRMGLAETDQDLVVLRNVVMSPFTTIDNFVKKMADVFQKVLEEEVENARQRNELTPSIHTFLVQGAGTDIFLVHTPTYHMANGRRQIILSAVVPPEFDEQVARLRAGHDESAAIVIKNVQPMLLDKVVNGESFEGTVSLHKQDSTERVQVSDIRIVKRRSLMSKDLGKGYPSSMPFYLYGTEKSLHIDHVLLQIPNVQLSAGDLICTFEPPLDPTYISEGVVVVANDFHEAAMQPFPLMKHMNENFFFRVGQKLSVTVYKDPYPASTMGPIDMSAFTEVITTGKIELGGNLYVDSDALNDASEANAKIPVKLTVDGRMREDDIEGWKSYVDDILK